MKIETLTELLTSQQHQILSLTIHMDCLIEELQDSGVLDSDKLDSRIKTKIEKVKAVANKLKEEQPIPPMFNYGGPIGEA